MRFYSVPGYTQKKKKKKEVRREGNLKVRIPRGHREEEMEEGKKASPQAESGRDPQEREHARHVIDPFPP